MTPKEFVEYLEVNNVIDGDTSPTIQYIYDILLSKIKTQDFKFIDEVLKIVDAFLIGYMYATAILIVCQHYKDKLSNFQRFIKERQLIIDAKNRAWNSYRNPKQ